MDSRIEAQVRMSRTWILLLVLNVGLWGGCSTQALPPIRVGILHSTTGSLASSEQSVANSTLLALEEINNEGGLLDRQIEIFFADGASDPEQFAQKATDLIVNDQVEVLFGCWSSASRKAVLPILETHKSLLFYPLQYEGLEDSPHVVYTGAVPNQQMVPGIKWAFDNLGKRFFLVGSDYIYPHAANNMARFQLDVLGGEVVGERYLLLGSRDVAPIIDAIEKARPDVILNTINGDSGAAFFKAMKKAGLDIPTLSMSATETEFRALGEDMPVGHYAAWSYFQSLDIPENQRFIQRYQSRFGIQLETSDPMEAAYVGVKLWAQAVQSAESSSPQEVVKSIGGQSLAAPEGLVSVDGKTHHCWKSVRIGQLQKNGQFSILWSSQGAVRPRPFPIYRQAKEWKALLEEWNTEWDGHWMNPAKS